MLFNSTVFLLFICLFFAFWGFAQQKKNRLFFYVIIASFIFYGWWDWRYLFLLIGSGCIDFTVGLLMVRYPRHRKQLLLLSLVGNLGSLALFKYSVFFAENLEIALSAFGIDTNLVDVLPGFVTVLPVGISFYTFQSMSYTFDIYRGKLQPTRNILHFFAYLSMFPQLVAGPIVRARDLLGQLERPPLQTENYRWQGTKLVATGYFMKVVLADNLAPFVNEAFANPDQPSSAIYWWIIMIAFAFQIYYDFAGYSRIARGLAYWMGYEFPQNFDQPYVATSLQDFWRRWHISLSTWFRDYLYFPLGGSHVSRWRVHLNLWIVMLVSGLWHGAAWNFIIWGGVHAAFYSFERETSWSEHLKRIPYVGVLATIFVTNFIVIIAWVFFRSPTTDQAIFILQSMFAFGVVVPIASELVFWVIFAIIFELLFLSARHIFDVSFDNHKHMRRIAVIAILFMLSVFFRGPGSEFIYFQF